MGLLLGRTTRRFRSTPDDANPRCFRIDVQLKIYSKTLKPDAMSRLLGLNPTDTVEAGIKTWLHPDGSVRKTKRPLNGWFLHSEGKVKKLEVPAHLDWMLRQLAKAKSPFRHMMEKHGARIRIDCVYWTDAPGAYFTLWPDQIAKLAELGIEFGFDHSVYPLEHKDDPGLT